MDDALQVSSVSKRFGGLVALDSVSMTALPGRVTSIIGQNGAGKTTLLNLITQLPPPDSGGIFLEGKALTGLSAHRVVELGVARTFQQLRIFAKLSVIDNVLVAFQATKGDALWRLCLTPRSVFRQERERIKMAHAILKRFGLGELAGEQADSLSYGMQKLLSLARIMATDAKVIMLDEPTSGLPADLIKRILEIVREMRAEGKIVVLVEHDMDVVFDISDRVVVLDNGKVFAEGQPAEIRSNADVRSIYFGNRVN